MKNMAFIIILLIITLIPSVYLNAADVSPPVVMLSSYSISGNMLTDKTITLHLVLTNTSQIRDVYDVLISYTSENQIFLPVYGISNQFFIPSIPAGSSVNWDLIISVNGAIPNDNLYFDFNVLFSDPVNGINENKFFISDFVKSANVIQLLGMEAIEINEIDSGSRIITFRATVINQSNFSVRNTSMILQGKDPDFNISVPLNDIGPGDHLECDFRLNLQSRYLPKIDVTFDYIDINGASYFSDPQQITVYLNNLLSDSDLGNVDRQMQIIFRRVGLILFFIFFTAGAVFLFFRFHKKKEI